MCKCILRQSQGNSLIISALLCKHQWKMAGALPIRRKGAHFDMPSGGDLYCELRVLKATDIYQCNILKFYFKYENKLLPYYFENMFESLPPPHSYNTRNRGQPLFNIPRTISASRSIRYALPSLLSNTPDCITEKVNTHSMNGFTNYIKKHYCSTYTDTCQISNCYVCNGS